MFWIFPYNLQESCLVVCWISVLCCQLLKVVCLGAIVPSFWSCLLSYFRRFLLHPISPCKASSPVAFKDSFDPILKINFFFLSLFCLFQHFQYSFLYAFLSPNSFTSFIHIYFSWIQTWLPYFFLLLLLDFRLLQ